jgi:hypothetical protein
MVGNTGTKVSITLMVEKYRNESKYHTNGMAIQERKQNQTNGREYRNKTKNHTNGREIQQRK